MTVFTFQRRRSQWQTRGGIYHVDAVSRRVDTVFWRVDAVAGHLSLPTLGPPRIVIDAGANVSGPSLAVGHAFGLRDHGSASCPSWACLAFGWYFWSVTVPAANKQQFHGHMSSESSSLEELREDHNDSDGFDIEGPLR